MNSIIWILVCLVGCCFSGPTGDNPTFSLDSLLNADVSLFPGESVTLADRSDNGVQIAVARIHEIVTDQTKLNFAYSIYLTQFKKSGMGTMEIFSSAIEKIMEHNINTRLGKSSYELGVNRFTDLSYEEAAAVYTGALTSNNTFPTTTESPRKETTTGNYFRERRGTAPPSKDWVAEGYVSPVKNQKQCGSCTIFAVTGAVESAYAICNNKQILDLSEQQVLDCSDGRGILHCSGNGIPQILDHVVANGETAEVLYPYKAVQEPCSTSARPIYAKPTGWFKVADDEELIKEALFTNGPLVVIVYVKTEIFHYKSGIYSGTECFSGSPHAVLIVGYGTENGVDYWLIKNSWDTWWGEKGYFRIKRGNNQCYVKNYVYALEMCKVNGGTTSTPVTITSTTNGPFNPVTPTTYRPYVNPFTSTTYRPYVNPFTSTTYRPYVNPFTSTTYRPYVNPFTSTTYRPYVNPFTSTTYKPYVNPFTSTTYRPYVNPFTSTTYRPYVNPFTSTTYRPYVNPFTSTTYRPYINPFTSTSNPVGR